MSYLGIKIIYHLLNEMDDCVCERVFAPWNDMESELLSSGVRLFSLESKNEINKFDILGFSLSYELTFTGVLNTVGGWRFMGTPTASTPLISRSGSTFMGPNVGVTGSSSS